MIGPEIPRTKQEQKLISFSLTSIEKNVLYKKYTNKRNPNRLDPFEANNKIREFIKYLIDLRIRLKRNKRLTEENINDRFKKEFEKLCLKLDGCSLY